AKVAVARSGLHEAWRKEAIELGFVGVPVIEQNVLPKVASQAEVDIDSILGTLTGSSSTFTVMQLEAEIATEAQGLLSAVQIERLIESTLTERLADRSKLGLIELQGNES